MNDSDLLKIENEFSIIIPQTTREALLFDIEENSFDIELFSANAIVSTYRKYLVEGYCAEAWLPHLLPIGKSRESTGVFFIDVKDKNPRLYICRYDSDPFYHPESYRRVCCLGLIGE